MLSGQPAAGTFSPQMTSDRNNAIELETRTEIQIQANHTYTIVYESGAICRKTKHLSSQQIAVLTVNTNVVVEKIDGRRCLISSPIYAWISSRTADGQTILKENKSNMFMQIEANVSKKESDNKQKLKKLLFTINLITFVISMISLILSFNELVAECAKRAVDLSAPYASYPICGTDVSKRPSCESHSDLKFVMVHSECESMLSDYGCGCNALGKCEGFNNDNCHTDDWVTSCENCSGDSCGSDCDTYSCIKYGSDWCRTNKYTMFILLVLFEFVIGIPQYGATYWEEKMKTKQTTCHKICCHNTIRAKICTKALQTITSWMINFSLYGMLGALGNVAHLEWLFIWLFVCYFLMVIFLFWLKKRRDNKDFKLCTKVHLCNLSESLANEFVPMYGCMLALFFVPFTCLTLFLPGGEIDAVLSSIGALFEFDFKVNLFIAMHTINLLLTQIVSTVRSLTQSVNACL
eukprot:265686_1